MLSFLKKEQQSGRLPISPRQKSVPPKRATPSQESADDLDLPKPKSRKMSEPETGSNLLSKVSKAVSSYCPSPGIRMRKNKRFGARSDLKEEVSWRTSSPKATKSGLVTKRSTRNPRTPMMSMSKKTLTKEDYKQLIEMHSRTLKETSSAPTLSFVDLTEDDAPSFKRIMTPTPAQRVSTRLKIIEEKESRASLAQGLKPKDSPSSSQEEAFLTQEQLFYEIQDRETGEEVARLEKELENIRLKRAAKLASREKTEAPLIDAICAKYLFTKAPAPKIPELNEDQLALVDSVWSRGRDKIVAEIAGEECKKSDLLTLRGRQWLNDLVINCYFNLIMQRAEADKELPRVFCFKTFFYPKVKQNGHKGVKRWTKKVDIFAMDRLLFPIHLGVHWTIAAALMKEKKVIYLDSMGASNEECRELILEYLRVEHEVKKGSELSPDWATESWSHQVPQQDNSSDCGVFTCKFGDYLSRGLNEFNFKAENMQTMRKAILVEIANKQLLF